SGGGTSRDWRPGGFLGRGGLRAPPPTWSERSALTTGTCSRRSATGCTMQRPGVAGLRARGRWPLPAGPRVALVGSRRPSPYGEAVAEQLSCDLAAAGVIVISGLALGIDAAAHRGALNGGGMTVAVMGTGVDLVYPAAHSRLAEDILAAGGAP